MSHPHYYEVNVKWTEGRKGELSSPILDETIECATPPEFTNGVANVWSPEHLFTASINSCYMSTFLAIAENFKLPFKTFTCQTVCRLEPVDGKYQMSHALIKPEVTLENPETDKEKLVKVLEKSKAACLVTNSLKTVVELEYSI